MATTPKFITQEIIKLVYSSETADTMQPIKKKKKLSCSIRTLGLFLEFLYNQCCGGFRMIWNCFQDVFLNEKSEMENNFLF